MIQIITISTVDIISIKTVIIGNNYLCWELLSCFTMVVERNSLVSTLRSLRKRTLNVCALSKISSNYKRLFLSQRCRNASFGRAEEIVTRWDRCCIHGGWLGRLITREMFSRFIARVRRRTIGVCDQTGPFLMALTDLQEFFFNTPFQGSR